MFIREEILANSGERMVFPTTPIGGRTLRHPHSIFQNEYQANTFAVTHKQRQCVIRITFQKIEVRNSVARSTYNIKLVARLVSA